MPKSVVILGDCKSNGLNTMAWKTCNNLDTVVNISLQHSSKYTKSIIQWYMNERKRGVYKDNFKMNQLQHVSFKRYKEYESRYAWPTYLNFAEVYNLSTTGITYQGYIADIKNHIETVGKPDLICITDTDEHIYVRTNYNGQKHNGPIYDSFLGTEYNPDVMPYCEGIYKKRQKQGSYENSKGPKYWKRKDAHSFYFLKRFLDKHSIKYFFLKFGESYGAEFFDSNCTLDISAIYNQFKSDQGTHSITCYAFQKTISEIVENHIKNNYA